MHYSVVFEAVAFLGRTLASSLTGSLVFSCVWAQLSGSSRTRLLCKGDCWQPSMARKSVVPRCPNKKSGSLVIVSRVSWQSHLPGRPAVMRQVQGQVSWSGHMPGAGMHGSGRDQGQDLSFSVAPKQKREPPNKAFHSSFSQGSCHSCLAAPRWS